MRCAKLVLVFLTVLVVSTIANVGQANWMSIVGDYSVSSDLAISGSDGQLVIGNGVDNGNTGSGSGSKGAGTLTQTGGTLTVSATSGWPTILGHCAAGTYTLSGSAAFNSLAGVGSSGDFFLGNRNSIFGTGSATLNIGDNATFNTGTLIFGESTDSVRPTGIVNLSGHAVLNASGIGGPLGTGDYISFASGSQASLTVADRDLASFESLASGGYLRVDGAVVSSFESAFQLSGHTVTLATPEPSALAILATGVTSLLAYAWRKRKCVPS